MMRLPYEHHKSPYIHMKPTEQFTCKVNKKNIGITPIRPTERRQARKILWECRCFCGKLCYATKSDIKKRKSCGCLSFKKSPYPVGIRRMYSNMKNRCYSDYHQNSRSYKKKNIRICDEWLKDPQLFYEWAINNSWAKGATIDRIDNNSDYSPKNCRFITLYENSARNGGKNDGRIFGDWRILRRNVLIKCIYCGKEKEAEQFYVTSRKIPPCDCKCLKDNPSTD